MISLLSFGGRDIFFGIIYFRVYKINASRHDGLLSSDWRPPLFHSPRIPIATCGVGG